MQNLQGGANYLAGGAAGARCGASWVFITLLSTLHGVRMPDACADVHCRRRHILNAGLRAGYRPGLLNYRALGNGVLEVFPMRAGGNRNRARRFAECLFAKVAGRLFAVLGSFCERSLWPLR